MKTIHEFVYKDNNGQETKFLLKEPSRKERDEALKFYKIRFNRAQKEGFLTRAMIVANAEQFGNTLLPKAQAEKMAELRLELQRIQQDLTENRLNNKDNVDKLNEVEGPLVVKFTEVTRELTALESCYQSSFEFSAENEAQSVTVLWYMFFLTFVKNGDQEVPYFKGNTYEEKLNYDYSLLDSEEEKHNYVRDKLLTYFSLYTSNTSLTKEQFSTIEKRYQEIAGVPSKEEEAKTEEVATEAKTEIVESK